MQSGVRRSFRLPPLVKPVFIGVCVGVVCTTLLLLLSAWLFYKLALPVAAVTPVAVAALCLGGFAGGTAVGLSAGQKGLLLGAVCGTLLYLILLIAGVAYGGGVSSGYAVLKWAVLMVCSAAGGVLGVNRRHP